MRFGLFELDLNTGELPKKGVRLHLQEQPFQVLAMLVERAGDLVTRDELRARLWPDDVFVDFDQGLNKVVAKLRGALGDLAESPRFVETLERRGYRLIAPVDMLDAPAGALQPSPRPTIVRFTWGDQVIVLSDGVHVIGRDPAAAISTTAMLSLIWTMGPSSATGAGAPLRACAASSWPGVAVARPAAPAPTVFRNSRLLRPMIALLVRPRYRNSNCAMSTSELRHTRHSCAPG